jgi:hypothetical protein
MGRLYAVDAPQQRAPAKCASRSRRLPIKKLVQNRGPSGVRPLAALGQRERVDSFERWEAPRTAINRAAVVLARSAGATERLLDDWAFALADGVALMPRGPRVNGAAAGATDVLRNVRPYAHLPRSCHEGPRKPCRRPHSSGRHARVAVGCATFDTTSAVPRRVRQSPSACVNMASTIRPRRFSFNTWPRSRVWLPAHLPLRYGRAFRFSMNASRLLRRSRN